MEIINRVFDIIKKYGDIEKVNNYLFQKYFTYRSNGGTALEFLKLFEGHDILDRKIKTKWGGPVLVSFFYDDDIFEEDEDDEEEEEERPIVVVIVNDPATDRELMSLRLEAGGEDGEKGHLISWVTGMKEEENDQPDNR